ncbi:MAG: SirA family protein [Firmicutes bacterium HGW-Firmicutes-8]|nr:MAG: SirA family protein [Firmicutes bacterium HGW-Firmicutes-8]
MQVIDARGLSCPEPVLLTKKSIDANAHTSFKVIVDDMATCENITALAKNLGWTVSHDKTNNHIEITLQK